MLRRDFGSLRTPFFEMASRVLTPRNALLCAVSLALSSTVPASSPSLANGIIGSRAVGLPRAEAAPTVTISNADLKDQGETATLTFVLSGPLDISAFVLSDPDRIILDLPSVAFDMTPEAEKSGKKQRRGAKPSHPAPAAGHLVSSYRFGSFAAGRSRVIVDLAGPAKIVRNEIKPGADGQFELTLQLAKTDRAAFRAAAQAARTHLAAAPAADPAKPAKSSGPAQASALPRILIDPGHGGIDSGAQNGGLIEKMVVLDFAKLLAAKLRATGRYDVVMTRDDDTFVTLGDRVKMARDDNAALFVSVHADTLNEADVSGATVYTVSDKASDLQAARVAEKENQADAAAGVEGQEEASGVSDILFDLTRRETRAYSHVFAHTLTNYWRVAARLNKNPERSAGFKVLTAPDVPSVLLELGYLSNEKDVAAFNSSDWREQTTSRVADAIESFFAARGNTTASIAAKPDEDAKPIEDSKVFENPMRGSLEATRVSQAADISRVTAAQH